MTTFPTDNFDDFPNGLPAGATLDRLAALFDLTRGDGETDASLLARLEEATGLIAQSTAQYFPS